MIYLLYEKKMHANTKIIHLTILEVRKEHQNAK